jgi:hypothetical protein
MARMLVDGAVELYYDSALKLETTATGVDVSGSVSADGLTVDSGAADLTATFQSTDQFADIKLTDSGGSSYVRQSNGSLLLQADRDNASVSSIVQISVDGIQTARFAAGGDISFYEDTGTTAKLFWDASAERLGIGNSATDVSGTGLDDLVVGDGSAGGGIVIDSGASVDGAYAFASAGAKRGRVRYDNSTDSMHFETNNTGDKLTIDSSGNVGIAVTPENSSGTWRNLQFGGGNLAFRNNGANDAMVGTGYLFKTDDSEVYKNAEAVSRLFFDNSTMIFQQAGSGTAGTAISWSEAMRIDASGNVKVGYTGTGTPGNGNTDTGHLLKSDGRFFASSASNSQFNRNSDGDILTFRASGVSVGSIGTLNANRLYFGGADTGIMIASDLDCIYPTNGGDTARNNAVDLGNSGTRFKDLYLSGTANAGSVLKVNSSVDGTEASPHFQIQAAASTYQLNYWLDGTAAYMGQNSALRSLRLYSSAETAGVQLSAGGTSWGTFSDERLKENVEPVENALQSLSGLRTVKYHLKDVDGPEDKKKIGVIAQDLVGVLDEVIDPAFRSDDDTEYMSVRYTELVPVLIKAIQEQQATIEALTARIAALES